MPILSSFASFSGRFSGMSDFLAFRLSTVTFYHFTRLGLRIHKAALVCWYLCVGDIVMSKECSSSAFYGPVGDLTCYKMLRNETTKSVQSTGQNFVDGDAVALFCTAKSSARVRNERFDFGPDWRLNARDKVTLRSFMSVFGGSTVDHHNQKHFNVASTTNQQTNKQTNQTQQNIWTN